MGSIDFEYDFADDALHSGKESPLFPVQARDKMPGSEINRVATFLAMMGALAPDVIVYANVNAARRGPKAIRQARREGMTPGVFDHTVAWNRATAWIEWKDGDGKPTPHQVAFGNRLYRQGHHVALFRTPAAALDWLRRLGCPIRRAS